MRGWLTWFRRPSVASSTAELPSDPEANKEVFREYIRTLTPKEYHTQIRNSLTTVKKVGLKHPEQIHGFHSTVLQHLRTATDVLCAIQVWVLDEDEQQTLGEIIKSKLPEIADTYRDTVLDGFARYPVQDRAVSQFFQGMLSLAPDIKIIYRHSTQVSSSEVMQDPEIFNLITQIHTAGAVAYRNADTPHSKYVAESTVYRVLPETLSKYWHHTTQSTNITKLRSFLTVQLREILGTLDDLNQVIQQKELEGLEAHTAYLKQRRAHYGTFSSELSITEHTVVDELATKSRMADRLTKRWS